MKTKKMTKTVIGVLAGVLLLSLSATAQATLSPNLLVNGDFTSTTISDNASGYLTSGQWYGSSTGWDLISTGGNPDPYAKLVTVNSVQHLIQAVELKTALPGYTATKGPVQVSFDYQASGLNLGQTYVNLYGSDNQPQYGNYGTLLGTISGTSFSKGKSTWTSISSSSLNWTDASKGYAWYTLDIYTKTQNKTGNYFWVDNVNVQVTPIPAAVWLLGSGLIGLAVLRRRAKT
ncbi:MAG: VPLPA-CTERM sorting domain-containing protein [Syntrophales bacterium]|nr:VPLPA-CTERM sorting domain-containing protein [Syntrophales bacterium]